ncbi:MAG: hypothetical protein K9G70_06205 [Prolixibacteraceae bacterium]|nr:hypothetical protein [Prolixibacteraceae bacterium]
MTGTINLKKEQEATLNTPRLKYSAAAKFFFFSMDLVTGKKNTLPKAKLLEILASIPYREWEIRNYTKETRKYKMLLKVENYQEIIEWSREAQDNEFTHLLVIHEKMREECMKDKWYLSAFVRFFVVLSYVIISKTMAFFNQKRAFLFNAEFENHAEGVYAGMVRDNPQWETQKVTIELVKEYANVETWADVFRRIGLDERDHMNNSFVKAGKPELVHKYDGMVEL